MIRLRKLLFPMRELMPYVSRQAAFLSEGSEALCEMLSAQEDARWKVINMEIRTLESQSDALMAEFRDQMAHLVLSPNTRSDLVTLSMSLDDSLDVVKDASNALIIYQPQKIDPQLQELARLIVEEAHVLGQLLPLLTNIKQNAVAIVRLCERITEQEHAADEAYEQYIGYIFAQEKDLREMTKYKNLAELFEKATDMEKHAADLIRIMIARYVS